MFRTTTSAQEPTPRTPRLHASTRDLPETPASAPKPDGAVTLLFEYLAGLEFAFALGFSRMTKPSVVRSYYVFVLCLHHTVHYLLVLFRIFVGCCLSFGLIVSEVSVSFFPADSLSHQSTLLHYTGYLRGARSVMLQYYRTGSEYWTPLNVGKVSTAPKSARTRPEIQEQRTNVCRYRRVRYCCSRPCGTIPLFRSSHQDLREKRESYVQLKHEHFIQTCLS